MRPVHDSAFILHPLTRSVAMLAVVENSSVAIQPPQSQPPAAGDLLPKAPPSARDFQVFHRAAIEGQPTREVAWQFEISQTRVCQIVKRVRVWLWEVLPDVAGQPANERQVQ